MGDGYIMIGLVGLYFIVSLVVIGVFMESFMIYVDDVDVYYDRVKLVGVEIIFLFVD